MLGGLVGGLVLTLILIVMMTWMGQDLWVALKGASAPFYGSRAAQPGFDAGPIVVGILAHFGISALWGLGFGLLALGLDRPTTIAFGVLWGVIVWLGMYYVVLPLVGLGSIAQHNPMGLAVAMHLVFGLAIAFTFLPFQRPHSPVDRAVPRPG